MSNYKQKSKAKLENQNFDNSTYYGMSLEPVYVGGANEEKLNAFSTQVNLLKQKGFHDEANLLKQDSDLYGIDQALYNLVLKADKQKQQRRVNENLQAIREGTGEVAKNTLPVLSMMPGVDTFSDIGYTVADAVKGNWKGVGIGLAAAAIPGVSYGVYKLGKQGYKNYKLKKLFNNVDELELFYYNLRNMYEKEFTTAPTIYYDNGKQKMKFPKTYAIHLDNNVLDKNRYEAWIDNNLVLLPREGSSEVWFKNNSPYYKNEFWERIIKTPNSDIIDTYHSPKPLYERVLTTNGTNMNNSEAMLYNPITLWFGRAKYTK